MRIVTIQNKQVLKTLLDNKIHYAKQTTAKNLIIPYNMMKTHYGWKTNPVFGCVIGRYSDFYGAITNDSAVLYLNIPDEFVKLQIYYEWTDLIYFVEFKNEWEYGDFNQFVIDTLNGKGTSDPNAIIQATFPYIKPEWLENYTEDIEKVEECCRFTGIL